MRTASRGRCGAEMLMQRQLGWLTSGEGGGDLGWRGQERAGVQLDAIVVWNGFPVVAQSKAKGRIRENPPINPNKELLGQVRIRKKLNWLQKEDEVSQEKINVPKVFPYWKKKSKTESESREFTRRIIDLSQRRQLDQVFALVREAKETSSLCTINMNAVMDACVRCNDMDRAIAVYQEMLLPGNCGVDNVTYGILIKGLGKARRLDDAFELVESIEAGTAPGHPVLSEVHLNTLMNACVEAGDSLRARGVLLRYRSPNQGLRPSVLTYNLLIKGCGRSENLRDALRLKEEMHLLELQPNRSTYNSLVFACVRAGDMENALNLFEEMKLEASKLQTSQLMPNVVTYTTLLKGFADLGDTKGVSRLVSEMQNSPTCVLDRVAYSAIIDAFISTGSPTDGLRFFQQEMQERAKLDTQFKPKPHVFLSLMRAFALKGDMDIVSSLRQQMVPGSAGKKSVEDRAEADELMIESAVNAGEVGVAQQILRNMVGIKKGIPLSKRAHTALVRLQVLLGFSEDLLKPSFLKPGVSLYDTVESVMLSYNETRPLLGEVQLKSVIMRFYKEDALPVVNEAGICIGVVHSQDCTQVNARLCDIMRPPPPEVTYSTPVERAVSLLLEPQVKVVAVVRTQPLTYSTKICSREVPLGFVTRNSVFGRLDSSSPKD